LFNFYLRFYFFFVFCLTWYILQRFGGYTWNGRIQLANGTASKKRERESGRGREGERERGREG
jgi:hypothetical protein